MIGLGSLTETFHAKPRCVLPSVAISVSMMSMGGLRSRAVAISANDFAAMGLPESARSVSPD